MKQVEPVRMAKFVVTACCLFGAVVLAQIGSFAQSAKVLKMETANLGVSAQEKSGTWKAAQLPPGVVPATHHVTLPRNEKIRILAERPAPAVMLAPKVAPSLAKRVTRIEPIAVKKAEIVPLAQKVHKPVYHKVDVVQTAAE